MKYLDLIARMSSAAARQQLLNLVESYPPGEASLVRHLREIAERPEELADRTWTDESGYHADLRPELLNILAAVLDGAQTDAFDANVLREQVSQPGARQFLETVLHWAEQLPPQPPSGVPTEDRELLDWSRDLTTRRIIGRALEESSSRPRTMPALWRVREWIANQPSFQRAARHLSSMSLGVRTHLFQSMVEAHDALFETSELASPPAPENGGVRVRAYWVGKPYSTSAHASARAEGARDYAVAPASRFGDIAAPDGREPAGIRHMLYRLVDEIQRQPQPLTAPCVLLMDDGAEAIVALHSDPALRPFARYFCCVEQTTRGAKLIRENFGPQGELLLCPVVNMAESWLKVQHESPMIGHSVWLEVARKLEEYRAYGINVIDPAEPPSPSKKTATVLGAGNVGRSVALDTARHLHTAVHMYDPRLLEPPDVDPAALQQWLLTHTGAALHARGGAFAELAEQVAHVEREHPGAPAAQAAALESWAAQRRGDAASRAELMELAWVQGERTVLLQRLEAGDADGVLRALEQHPALGAHAAVAAWRESALEQRDKMLVQLAADEAALQADLGPCAVTGGPWLVLHQDEVSTQATPPSLADSLAAQKRCLTQALQHAHVLISCAGRPTVSPDDMESVPDGAPLFNAASSNDELSAGDLLLAFESSTVHVFDDGSNILAYDVFQGEVICLGLFSAPAHSDVVLTLPSGKQLVLVHHGYVINMTGEADPIPPEYIQLTRSLIHASEMFAVAAALEGMRGLVHLARDVQEKILSEVAADLEQLGESLARPEWEKRHPVVAVARSIPEKVRAALLSRAGRSSST